MGWGRRKEPGRIEEGTFLANLREGIVATSITKGKYSKFGVVMIGEYHKDQCHGRMTIYNRDGSITNHYCVNG